MAETRQPASLPAYAWRNAEMPSAAVAAMAASLELPTPVAGLLAARGHGDRDAILRWLDPAKQKLTDALEVAPFRAAAGRLQQAIAGGSAMVVFGDFDVDGVVAAALLSDMILGLGGRVRPFLPDRHREGYGLTGAALARCLDGGHAACAGG